MPEEDHMNPYILALIIESANNFGIDPNLVLAVIKVESNFNVDAKSPTNDFGLMQLNKKAFPEFTEQQLLNPKTNIYLGVKHLSDMKKQCIHKNNNDWLVCWNYGISNAKKVKNPSLFPFVKKVNAVYVDM